LAAGEKAVDAAVDALGVGNRVRGRAIALVALGSTFVGCDSLGGVGASVAQACSLAVHIAGVAVHGTADSGRETARNGGSRWGAGNRRILGKGEGANGEEENSGVLHLEFGLGLGITRRL